MAQRALVVRHQDLVTEDGESVVDDLLVELLVSPRQVHFDLRDQRVRHLDHVTLLDPPCVLVERLVDLLGVVIRDDLLDLDVLLAVVHGEGLDLTVLPLEGGFVAVRARVDQPDDAVDVLQVGRHRRAGHQVDRDLIAQLRAHLIHGGREDRIDAAKRMRLVEEEHVVA